MINYTFNEVKYPRAYSGSSTSMDYYKKNVQKPFRIGKYLGTLAFYTYHTTNTMIIWNRFVIRCEVLPHIRPFCRYILPF
jgi:hypothetical protein